MPFVIESPTPSPPPVHDAARVRREQHHAADVVVVGAGVLGCAIAVTFARQGRSVILLEQSLKEPDRIIGEFLQPAGLQALKRLGLRDCLEGIDACVTKGYEVRYYGTPVSVPYPSSSNSDVETEGRSFHHGRFIRKLREAALREPNILVRESKVVSLIRSPDSNNQVLGVECITNEKRDYYFGELTVAADGSRSLFRADYQRAPVVKSRFWGLELIDADLPSPLHGHVVLTENAPVLLYQIGTHETRILIDIPEGTPTASVASGGTKSHMKNVVLPSLPKQIQPSFAAALETGRLRSMPNPWLPPTTNRTHGLMILGDALNMRHPLTGGGMTVALNDVVLVRSLLSVEEVPNLADTKKVLKQLKTLHWQRKRLSSVINILAMALYSLFAANDYKLRALQQGCFRYFQRGGKCVSEPVGLLGGIIRDPMVLFYHFFSVALYAMWVYVWQQPIWRLPMTLVECALIFIKSCQVIFPFIYSEIQS